MDLCGTQVERVLYQPAHQITIQTIEEVVEEESDPFEVRELPSEDVMLELFLSKLLNLTQHA